MILKSGKLYCKASPSSHFSPWSFTPLIPLFLSFFWGDGERGDELLLSTSVGANHSCGLGGWRLHSLMAVSPMLYTLLWHRWDEKRVLWSVQPIHNRTVQRKEWAFFTKGWRSCVLLPPVSQAKTYAHCMLKGISEVFSWTENKGEGASARTSQLPFLASGIPLWGASLPLCEVSALRETLPGCVCRVQAGSASAGGRCTASHNCHIKR